MPTSKQLAKKRYEKEHKAERQKRKEYWLFEFYPDSAPENWRDIINSWMVDCLVSPLHDKDVNEDGTPKKAHYHGILFFETLKTFEQVAELIKPLNGPIPQRPFGSKRNCARYLCHLNNPEKYQYDEQEVSEFQSACYAELKQRDNDKYEVIGEMMDWIDEQGQFSYAVLLRFARDNKPDWFRCLCDNGTYVMKEYCKTTAYDFRQETRSKG